MCDVFGRSCEQQTRKKVKNEENKETGKQRLEHWAIRGHLRVTNYIVSVLNEQL